MTITNRMFRGERIIMIWIVFLSIGALLVVTGRTRFYGNHTGSQEAVLTSIVLCKLTAHSGVSCMMIGIACASDSIVVGGQIICVAFIYFMTWVILCAGMMTKA